MMPRIRPATAAILIAFFAVAFPGGSSGQDRRQALERARGLLSENAQALGLQVSDLEDLVVTDTYTTKHNQVTHIYVRQRLNGIAIANGSLTLNLDRSGRLLSSSSRFITES